MFGEGGGISFFHLTLDILSKLGYLVWNQVAFPKKCSFCVTSIKDSYVLFKKAENIWEKKSQITLDQDWNV